MPRRSMLAFSLGLAHGSGSAQVIFRAKPNVRLNMKARRREDRGAVGYAKGSSCRSKDTCDIEITGYPVVTLFITSTHTDGAFFVYLEEIDEKGRVTYLTEGQLRALHRRVSGESPTKVPLHSFMKKDAMPLVPGEIAELRFGLQPISVLVKKGHRLRVAIAGHDKGTLSFAFRRKACRRLRCNEASARPFSRSSYRSEEIRGDEADYETTSEDLLHRQH